MFSIYIFKANKVLSQNLQRTKEITSKDVELFATIVNSSQPFVLQSSSLNVAGLQDLFLHLTL